MIDATGILVVDKKRILYRMLKLSLFLKENGSKYFYPTKNIDIYALFIRVLTNLNSQTLKFYRW